MIEILENIKIDESSGISDGSIDFETFSYIYMFIEKKSFFCYALKKLKVKIKRSQRHNY